MSVLSAGIVKYICRFQNIDMRLLLLFTLLSISAVGYSQDKKNTILELEKKWTRLLENKDTTALKELWSSHYVVNNAAGKVVNVRNILDLIKSGHRFPKVERQVENITFNDDIAVVMGGEIEYGKDHKIKNRRFTNVWRMEDGSWKLIARQATGN